ncbi:hypothetical protein BH18ACT15_BH18ACT15_11900 [soil metagenome]
MTLKSTDGNRQLEPSVTDGTDGPYRTVSSNRQFGNRQLEPSVGSSLPGWTRVLAAVAGRSKRVWGFLNPSSATVAEDGTIVVSGQASFPRDALTRPRDLLIIAAAVCDVYGEHPAIRIVSRTDP